jgi:hypothetical protein
LSEELHLPALYLTLVFYGMLHTLQVALQARTTKASDVFSMGVLMW